VPELAKLSAKRVQDSVTKSQWSVDDFRKLVEETNGSTGDEHLQKVLVNMASTRLSQLVDSNMFREGVFGNDLVAAILKSCIVSLKDLEGASGGAERAEE
jgi:hypothetical protein